MKLLHISDSHGYHEEYKLQQADVLIHTGDESNHISQWFNEHEFLKFFDWFREASRDYSLTMFIPGNHSTYVFENERVVRKMFADVGIEFMHKRSVIVDGLEFYGDSICPRYGNWAYMTDRSKTNKHWEQIPDTTNILLTHTPPHTTLDLTENRDRSLEMCGDKALLKRVYKLPQLKAHLFGHLHNGKGIENSCILNKKGIIFSNATAVEDGKFEEGIKNHGNIIKIERDN